MFAEYHAGRGAEQMYIDRRHAEGQVALLGAVEAALHAHRVRLLDHVVSLVLDDDGDNDRFVVNFHYDWLFVL